MNDVTPSYSFMRLVKHIWNVLLLKTGKRISVGESILASICISIFSSILSLILLYIFNSIGNFLVFSIISIVVNILIFAYSMVLLTNRLHDLGKRRTHIFYLLIPIYNIIRGIRVALTKGNPGTNQYGPDPLASQPKSNKLYRLFWFLGCVLSIGISLGTPISLQTSLLDSALSTGSTIEATGSQQLVPENIQVK